MSGIGRCEAGGGGRGANRVEVDGASAWTSEGGSTKFDTKWIEGIVAAGKAHLGHPAARHGIWLNNCEKPVYSHEI